MGQEGSSCIQGTLTAILYGVGAELRISARIAVTPNSCPKQVEHRL